MIFDKARIAKLSGLMTEGKSAKGPTDGHEFGDGSKKGDPWLDGEVSTADHDLHEGDEDDEGMKHMEARRKKRSSDDEEEKAVREMIRTEMRKAKSQMDAEVEEEKAVREAVRKEIRSVLRSRGVSMGGTGWGFKR